MPNKPPAYPYFKREKGSGYPDLIKIHVTISAGAKRILEEIADGNISAGIEKLARAYQRAQEREL